MRSLWIPFVMILALLGCASEEDVLIDVVGHQGSHFRGSDIGDAYETVHGRLLEDGLQTEESDELTAVHRKGGMEMTTRYEFDAGELFAIQADIFFADSARLNHFRQALTSRYNATYGEVTEEAGFLVWQQLHSKNEDVEITVADESFEFGQPKLSITIYNFEI